MCRLDGNPWEPFQPCLLSSVQPPVGQGTATVRVDNLTDGIHTLEITCVDAASNGHVGDVSNATAHVVLSWKVDTVSPQGFLRTWPRARVTSNTSAAFSVMSDDNGMSAFTCVLDGTAGPCTSAPPGTTAEAAVAYHGLSHGAHTFRVVTADAAGNSDAATAPAFTWYVDTQPPRVHLDQVSHAVGFFPYGSVSTSGDMQLEFSADEEATRFRCRLSVLNFDGRAACCTAAFAATLPECVPPCTSNASGEALRVCVGTSNVSLAARRIYTGCVEEAIRERYGTASTDAMLVKGPWEDCTSPYAVSGLGAAHAYWMQVAAVDARDNDGVSAMISGANTTAWTAQWFWYGVQSSCACTGLFCVRAPMLCCVGEGLCSRYSQIR